MNKKRLSILAIALCFAMIMPLKAEDLKRILSLTGYWQFSIGDDPVWAAADYNDSEWDHVMVPGKWEEQGYNEYNGYAWYRKTVEVDNLPQNSTIYLVLGRIDDVDEVYVNGKLLGRTGSFPPVYNTAYGNHRKYVVPAGLLKENGNNTFAVKVYDGYRDGGMLSENIGLFIDYDQKYLNLNLTGRWKIHQGDNRDWRAADFPDDSWKRINVPGEWDNQGFADYDGIAWYRVKFRVPADYQKGDLYLSLGKIDDIDEVYLNGKFIGSVYDLKHDWEYRRSGMEYNARRFYKISSGMLKYGEVNTIAIRVTDLRQRGGIYEGPIGMMSPENYKRYRNKYATSASFWNFFFNYSEY